MLFIVMNSKYGITCIDHMYTLIFCYISVNKIIDIVFFYCIDQL